MRRVVLHLLCLILVSGSFVVAQNLARQIVAKVDPYYPALAQRNNIHGIVKLKIWVSASGSVTRVEYLGGHPLLAESALKAVRQWTFAAAKQETTETVELKF